LIAFFLSLGMGYYVESFSKNLLNFDLVHHFDSPLFQYIVVLIIVDFLGYAYHIIAHKTKFLWEIHKYHHTATELCVLTSQRNHPLENIFTKITVAIPLAILGVPLAEFILFNFISTVLSYLRHSNVPWDFSFIGKSIFYSPVAHQIHHSDHPDHFNSNFGGQLVIWDRIFGTYYEGETKVESYGLPDNPHNKNCFLDDLWECYQLFLQRLYSKVIRGEN
jgi:sterol desaturase/sphingolipid hydroxylase (fatty acid hydroxylase superfamily)